MKKKIAISLDKNLLEKIDKKRGLISRSAYINKLLKERLKGG